ncbi:MAG: hypothetical protein ACTSO7_10330 [Candidatus Heimdallarchaeota archaeon]
MKNKNKNLIIIGFLLSIFLMGFAASKTNVVDSLGEEIGLWVTDAYYGDFDGDQSEDDIKVKAILNANFKDNVMLFLYLDITLPSGYVHKFTFQLDVEFEGSNKLVIITAYNTATESGWYDTKLSGLAVYQDMILFSYSTYTFDPPTENGNGDPEAVISII